MCTHLFFAVQYVDRSETKHVAQICVEMYTMYAIFLPEPLRREFSTFLLKFLLKLCFVNNITIIHRHIVKKAFLDRSLVTANQYKDFLTDLEPIIIIKHFSLDSSGFIQVGPTHIHRASLNGLMKMKIMPSQP